VFEDRRGAGAAAEKTPASDVLELDEESDDEEALARPRRLKRAAGKAKAAPSSMSVEELKREIRAVEAQMKSASQDLYEGGERLNRLLRALPPSL
jgi:hypothetical protein